MCKINIFLVYGNIYLYIIIVKRCVFNKIYIEFSFQSNKKAVILQPFFEKRISFLSSPPPKQGE